MATATSTGSGSWSGAIWSGGSGSGGAPADGDAVVIAAGHNVLMDSDLSAWTGLTTLTITSHATTPGMLYFKNGTDGFLRFRTGTNYGILGTNDGVTLGRLLANHDGSWPAGDTDDPLTFANKAVIQLDGTSRIMGTYLAIKLFCAQPTNSYVEVYGTAYTCTDQTTDVNTTTGVITFTGAPPTAGTLVMIKSSGTLPTGLTATDVYYTRTISGNTCKLALQNADAQIVIPSATGSGTLTMYRGHTSTSTKEMAIVQDLSADSAWVTTANHNSVCLVDCNAPENYDQQRDTIASIDTAAPYGLTITSANVDSAQYPLARIYLISRNVSIRFTGNTAVNILDVVHDSILQCEIRATAGTGTTFYGNALNASYSNTVSGAISGCTSALISSYSNTVSGTISGCSNALNASYSNTVSGTISGCSNALYSSYSNTVSGTISGCSSALNSSYSNTVSGTISGCTSALNASYSNTVSGTISGCSNALISSYSNTVSGTISGCSSVSRRSINNILRNNVDLGAATVLYSINSSYDSNRLRCENLNRVDGTHKIYDNYGDVLKTACDGTGDAPSADPDGGSGYCVEASNIQSACGAALLPSGKTALRMIEDVRIWLAAGTYTLGYKVQTTYTTSVDLVLTIDYIGTSSVITRATKSAAVAARSAANDWTNTITSDSFTTSAAGWVTVSLDLVEYESGCEVYVWPEPVIT